MAFKCYFRVVFILFVLQFLVISHAYSPRECGVPLRRHTRQPRERSAGQLRIIKGRESKRGAWPWQVSLQLLHPNYGLIGHWCGGVLIHPQWLLTTAHCIHNELFNLPVPALWTAVLGEWDRAEQRGSYLPIERIVLHQRFHNYQHDIALMKMIKAADVSAGSRIRTICLPSYELPINHNTERSTSFFKKPDEIRRKPKPPRPNPDTAVKYLEKLNNLTKTVFSGVINKKHKNTRYNVRVSNESNRPTERKNDEEINVHETVNKVKDLAYDSASLDSVVKLIKTKAARDKIKDSINRSDKKLMFGEEIDPFIDDNNGLDFKDECYATGWGREQTNGTLTDVLLEAEVPVLPLQLCRDRYSLSLPLNDGHLCAGSTDGSTGACVGDSGGPLQCRSGGRWELRGLTSFGSGCARMGVPDVYTNVGHYVSWIYAHIYAS
ncbi:transmembrane protease serine 13-like [Vanessa cardui]|uniref:transmembrane protease serine 13-like n=1 Tax=Vanessa cardui TaxID=171605 RepID=UPI001F13D53C|nr:transmembrane protease serine 13-like [Vanessa cardui]XP_046967641.1 transmembrane protease serine 13-like [Vanessa cardui]